MPYVLQKTDSPRAGYYVAASGSTHAYTRDLALARQFPTREAASADACGNERATPFNPADR